MACTRRTEFCERVDEPVETMEKLLKNAPTSQRKPQFHYHVHKNTLNGFWRTSVTTHINIHPKLTEQNPATEATPIPRL